MPFPDDFQNYCGYLSTQLDNKNGQYYRKFFRLDRMRRLFDCYPDQDTIFNKHSIVLTPVQTFDIGKVSMVGDGSIIGSKIPHSFYISIWGNETLFQADTETEKQEWIEILLDAARLEVHKRNSMLVHDVKGGYRVDIIAGVAVKTPLEDSMFSFPSKTFVKSSSSSVNSQLSSISSSQDCYSDYNSSPLPTPVLSAKPSPHGSMGRSYRGNATCDLSEDNDCQFNSLDSQMIMSLPCQSVSYQTNHNNQHSRSLSAANHQRSLSAITAASLGAGSVRDMSPRSAGAIPRSSDPSARLFSAEMGSQGTLYKSSGQGSPRTGQGLSSSGQGSPGQKVHLDRLVSYPADNDMTVNDKKGGKYRDQFRLFRPGGTGPHPLFSSQGYRVGGRGGVEEEMRRSHRLRSDVPDVDHTLLGMRALSLSNLYDTSLNVCRKAGFCNKLGAIRKNWKRRYFRLDLYGLSYYASKRDKAPIRSISLLEMKQVRPSMGIHITKLCVFEIVTEQRVYYIQADNIAEMQSWIKEIKAALQSQLPPKTYTSSTQTDEENELKSELLFTLKEMRVTDV